ncbi:hypothetical protein [Pantoea agglomerans]|uniref:hypothetical protein n=1 Tax=Enterobacter agglomerans TaxID=549 RepID=UPI001F414437|nr:hypothetical protein [Pantoea agglomerans]
MLTRDILSSAAPEEVFGRLGTGRYLSDDERLASMLEMLQSRPEGRASGFLPMVLLSGIQRLNLT